MAVTNIDIATPFRLPPYFLNHHVPVLDPRLSEPPSAGTQNVISICPLAIKWAEEPVWWYFPIDPVVSISGKNNIVKRSVLKVPNTDIERRGTVKELWSQDDYSITISGMFISKYNGLMPEEDILRLRSYCEGRKSVEVKADIFTLYNITKVAIESYEFPFTKGMENQMFSIKASSDDFDKKNLLTAI